MKQCRVLLSILYHAFNWLWNDAMIRLSFINNNVKQRVVILRNSFFILCFIDHVLKRRRILSIIYHWLRYQQILIILENHVLFCLITSGEVKLRGVKHKRRGRRKPKKNNGERKRSRAAKSHRVLAQVMRVVAVVVRAVPAVVAVAATQLIQLSKLVLHQSCLNISVIIRLFHMNSYVWSDYIDVARLIM